MTLKQICKHTVTYRSYEKKIKFEPIDGTFKIPLAFTKDNLDALRKEQLETTNIIDRTWNELTPEERQQKNEEIAANKYNILKCTENCYEPPLPEEYNV